MTTRWCEATAERLPWLLNKSLATAEADQLRAHLAGCPRCRDELEEARRAAAVFGAHLPVSAIMDLAWDRAVEGWEPTLAQAHVDGCADCREELALARESRDMESGWPEGPVRRRRSPWPLIALPATLAAGLVIGLWWGASLRERSLSGDAGQPERARVSSLEVEVARLRGMVATLQTSAQQAQVPHLNLPVFEIVPGRLLRGAEGLGNEVLIPMGATEIALLLSADAPNGTRATLEIQDGERRLVWRGDGLVYGPPGGYVVTVPVSLLPDGSYVLRLRPQSGAAGDYRVRVRRAR